MRAVIPALLIHISIGTLYCWSVFKQLIADQMHVVPGVVEWNRGPLGEKSGRPLLDPRTVIRMEDVAKVLQAEPEALAGML